MIPAVIIDDAPLAHKIIQKVVTDKFLKRIKIIGNATDVKSGIECIKKNNPKIIFLDIEMPDGTGFDLLHKLKEYNFKLIFITAHEEYSLKAIKFSALDYLLKPLNEEEINIAIEKAIKQISEEEEQLKIKILLENHERTFKKIIIKTTENIHVLETANIIHCESDNNYTNFYLKNNEKILASKTLKHYDSLLKNLGFIRVHKSHLINLNYIKKIIKGNPFRIYLINETIIPVSVRKKEKVLEAIRNFNA